MKDLNNLVWIDLEMTGLSPEKDVIIEIASIVTDSNLNIIAEGPEIAIHQPEENLKNLSEWVEQTHGSSGLLQKVRNSKISLQEAEEQTLKFIQDYCVSSITPLCGNSIWQDRRFLIKHMPKLNDFFHYRNIDVSSIKELVKRWYNFKYQKNNVHRALDDIKESIDELKLYRKKFFIPQD